MIPENDHEIVFHEKNAWTVGDLRRALEGVPDDVGIAAFATITPGGAYLDQTYCHERVIYAAHFAKGDDLWLYLDFKTAAYRPNGDFLPRSYYEQG
jgi:Family of unknown function (DUF6225)